MKKALFGYSIKETDALFNSMQNHIDALTGKITNLNAELAAKSGYSYGNGDYKDLDVKVTHLEETIKELKKENAALKNELSESGSAPQESGKKVEHIGKIYLTAYEEAEKIKSKAITEAEEYLKRFAGIKKELKRTLTADINDIRSKQSNMEALLNDSVEKIVAALRDFSIESELIMKKVESIEKDVDIKTALSEPLE